MNWVLLTKKLQKMGLMRREVACLALLILLMILLQSETTPCYADHVYGRFMSRFRAGHQGSKPSTTPVKSSSRGGFRGNPDYKDGDEIFGADKRRVYTGPNPLHNR